MFSYHPLTSSLLRGEEKNPVWKGEVLANVFKVFDLVRVGYDRKILCVFPWNSKSLYEKWLETTKQLILFWLFRVPVPE